MRHLWGISTHSVPLILGTEENVIVIRLWRKTLDF